MRALSRRGFMAASATLAAAGCISHGESKVPEQETQAGTQPNVLFILTDQHRMECLGAYGNREIATPHIDALAADGMRFNNSFCPYPVCTPSRYSMISGLYVHEHRGWTNHCTLPPDVETFPKLLRQAGYHTKAVGKMHYTPTYLDVGFDEMILAEQNGPGRWDDDYHRALRAEGLIDGNDLEDQETAYRKQARPEYWETFGALASNLPTRFHSTEWIGERANDALKQWKASGELLAVSFIKPHHPFDPPAEYASLYDPAKLTLLPGWTEACFAHDLAAGPGYFPHEKLTEPVLRRAMAFYYATIQHIDVQVGKLLQTLKEKGLYDNTLIVFTSDHGELLGHHHLLLKGGYLYDPLAKVPLIIKLPGNLQQGTVSEGLVSNVDLAPTILAQARRPVPERMRGLDLARHPDARELVFAESGEGAQAMARTHTKKLILHRGPGPSLFFDLEKDPYELENRYEDPAYQDEIKRLTQALEAWRGPNVAAKAYVDENAPVIAGANVPRRDDDHRKQMMSYAREKMAGGWQPRQ